MAAVIYARISQDKNDLGLGVQRQLEDCRQLAAGRGWRVIEEYVDNDISAHTGKPRPAYVRMLADIEAGLVDAVICYHQDRLTRRPMEFEAFAELCQRVGLVHFASVTSDIVLDNDDGLFMARVLAAVAAKESARRSARQTRANLQKAQAGLPHGGGVRRAFGYAEDRVTIVQAEADVIRGAVDRFIARESMVAITRWVREQGLPTVTGRPWVSWSLRHMIVNPRIAGWRVYRGERVARAIWPPIVDDATLERSIAEHGRRAAIEQKPPRRYLLSGKLRCSWCGSTLYCTTQGTKRIYRCQRGLGHPGCGRIRITQPSVEEALVEEVLARLETSATRSTIRENHYSTAEHDRLLAAQDNARIKLDELILMWTDDCITTAELHVAREPLHKQLQEAERQLAQIVTSKLLEPMTGDKSTTRSRWSELDLPRQRDIVDSMLEFATILPGPPGRVMDPSRIVPTWLGEPVPTPLRNKRSDFRVRLGAIEQLAAGDDKMSGQLRARLMQTLARTIRALDNPSVRKRYDFVWAAKRLEGDLHFAGSVHNPSYRVWRKVASAFLHDFGESPK